MNKLLKICLIVIAVIFGLIFHMKNGHLVEFDYYVGRIELSLSWLLFAVFFCGVIIGWLISFPALCKLKYKNYRLQKKQKQGALEGSRPQHLPR